MIVTISIYLLVFVVAIFLFGSLRNVIVRYFFIVVHSVFLVLLSLWLSTQSPFFLAEQLEALEWITEVKEFFIKPDLSTHTLAANYILVDTSKDLELIDDSAAFDPMLPDAGPKQVITNRERLAHFFNLINFNKSYRDAIDLVVCDIYFPEDAVSKDDSLLSESMKGLLGNPDTKSKLLIARVDPGNAEITSEVNDSTDFGFISINYFDDYFFNYKLEYSELTQSLAYQMYKRLYGVNSEIKVLPILGNFLIEQKPDNSSQWALNTFIPDNIISEANMLGRDGEEKPVFSKASEHLHSDGFCYFLKDPETYLGERLTALEKGDSYTGKRKKNIVIIGAFTDEKNDIHRTLYGKIHGGLLVMNVFENLVKGNHLIRFANLLFLFVIFFFITEIILNKSLSAKNGTTGSLHWLINKLTALATRSNWWLEKQIKWTAVKTRLRTRNFRMFSYAKLLYHWLGVSFVRLWHANILDRWIFWLLVGAVFISQQAYGQVMNVVGLSIYLGILGLVLSTFTEYIRLYKKIIVKSKFPKKA